MCSILGIGVPSGAVQKMDRAEGPTVMGPSCLLIQFVRAAGMRNLSAKSWTGSLGVRVAILRRKFLGQAECVRRHSGKSLGTLP